LRKRYPTAQLQNSLFFASGALCFFVSAKQEKPKKKISENQ